MTPEERFARIEQALERMTALQEKHQATMYGLQESNQKMLGSLTESIGKLTESTTAFAEEARAYAADSRARMARLEANLDALIRAITTEHKNGKNK